MKPVVDSRTPPLNCTMVQSEEYAKIQSKIKNPVKSIL